MLIRLVLFFLFTNYVYSYAQQMDTTVTGFHYIHHIKNNRNIPKIGDYVFYNVYYRNGNELITSSQIDIYIPRIKISSPEKAKKDIGALNIMSIGDSLSVFLPVKNIDNPPNGIKNIDTLIIDFVVLDIKTEEEYNASQINEEKELAFKIEVGKKRAKEVGLKIKDFLNKYNHRKLGKNLIITSSGLQYYIENPNNKPKAESENVIALQYFGAFKNGESFDDSFSRGMESFKFMLGQDTAIPGWEEGLTYFSEGEKGFLVIPSKLAYGKEGAGSIKPNTDLFFYIEVEKIIK